jgi:Fic family protein
MVSKIIIKRIDKKLQLIQAKRPLSVQLVRKLKQQFSFELTYNSNAIEGNKLTLKETYLVINDGMAVKGKSLKDHLEAKNHNEAVHYLYELVEYGKKTYSQ